MEQPPYYEFFAHVFQIDPRTKRNWLALSSESIQFQLHVDSTPTPPGSKGAPLLHLFSEGPFAPPTPSVPSPVSAEGTLTCPLGPSTQLNKTSSKFLQWADRSGTVFGLGFSNESELSRFQAAYQAAVGTTGAKTDSSTPGSGGSTAASGSLDLNSNERMNLRASQQQPFSPQMDPKALDDRDGRSSSLGRSVGMTVGPQSNSSLGGYGKPQSPPMTGSTGSGPGAVGVETYQNQAGRSPGQQMNYTQTQPLMQNTTLNQFQPAQPQMQMYQQTQMQPQMSPPHVPVQGQGQSQVKLESGQGQNQNFPQSQQYYNNVGDDKTLTDSISGLGVNLPGGGLSMNGGYSRSGGQGQPGVVDAPNNSEMEKLNIELSKLRVENQKLREAMLTSNNNVKKWNDELSSLRSSLQQAQTTNDDSSRRAHSALDALGQVRNLLVSQDSTNAPSGVALSDVPVLDSGELHPQLMGALKTRTEELLSAEAQMPELRMLRMDNARLSETVEKQRATAATVEEERSREIQQVLLKYTEIGHVIRKLTQEYNSLTMQLEELRHAHPPVSSSLSPYGAGAGGAGGPAGSGLSQTLPPQGQNYAQAQSNPSIGAQGNVGIGVAKGASISPSTQNN